MGKWDTLNLLRNSVYGIATDPYIATIIPNKYFKIEIQILYHGYCITKFKLNSM